jgi:SAM-dependent methyltransferase
MKTRWMKVRDLFAMRAHFGLLHVLLCRLRTLTGTGGTGGLLDRMLQRMDRRTAMLSARFDATHGTTTFQRLDVRVSADPDNATVWGYSAVNQDFFREILRSVPDQLAHYDFVDIGSGMGAAILYASEFEFRKLVGVELTRELIDIARTNVEIFNRSTGRALAPDWVHCDFFQWEIPAEPQLFFFNNPFPESITVDAIQAVERSLAKSPRRALLVFRKPPQSAADHLARSGAWKPVRLAPYWRIYSSTAQV